MTEPRIEAVVFDLGGVLIEVEPERTVHAWAETTGLPAAEITGRLGAILSDPFERGDLTPTAFRADMVGRLGVPLSDEAFDAGWLALLGDPLPGAEALLADLAGRLRVAVLTNTNALHTPVWTETAAAVLRHVERVFTSHDLRTRKPEPAAFQAVLNWLGLPAARVAFFDDNADNIAAAAALGMAARQVFSPQEVRHELAALGALPGADDAS